LVNYRILGFVTALAAGCGGAEGNTETPSNESVLPMRDRKPGDYGDTVVLSAPREIPRTATARWAPFSESEDDSRSHESDELPNSEYESRDDDLESDDEVSDTASADDPTAGNRHEAHSFPIALPSSSSLNRTSSDPWTRTSHTTKLLKSKKPKFHNIKSILPSLREGPTLLVRNEADWKSFKNSEDARLSFAVSIDFQLSDFLPDPFALVLEVPLLRKVILAAHQKDDHWIRRIQSIQDGLPSRCSLEVVIKNQ
jgi:hypothetical protein